MQFEHLKFNITEKIAENKLITFFHRSNLNIYRYVCIFNVIENHSCFTNSIYRYIFRFQSPHTAYT